MSLEERIRQSVGNALDEVRARVEAEVRAIAQELIASAAEEQQVAIAAARETAISEARRDIDREIADAEARALAVLDERVLDARAHEREQLTKELTERLTAEADTRVRAVTEDGEARLQAALQDATADAARSLDEAVAAAREAGASERDLEGTSVARLLDAVRGLDGAASLSDVLDALGQAAAREVDRAALVVIRGDRVQGWTLGGFGSLDAQPRSLDLPLNQTGLISTAAGARRVVTTADTDAPDGFGFAEIAADRIGLAIPVIVGGRVVAVLSADIERDASARSPRRRGRDVLEILARHAGRCLESLTAQKATQAPPARASAPALSKPGVSA